VKIELELPLTPRACAELSGLSYDTILRRIRSGHLKAYKPPGNKDYLVNPEDFHAWLYGHPVDPAPSADQDVPPRSPRSSPAGSLARLRSIERGHRGAA
jgi:excisionase family DNA binding protein